jgi:hypothetical protein
MLYTMPVSAVQRDTNLLWWIATLVLIVLGGYCCVDSWITGLMLFGIAAVISPLVYNQLLIRLKASDPLHLRVVIILLGLIASTYVLNVHVASMQAEEIAAAVAEKARVESSERQRKAAAERAKVDSTRQYYSAHQQAILQEMGAALDSKAFAKASAINDRYTGAIMDPAFLALQKRLQALEADVAEAKREQDRKDKIASLLADLKSLNANDYTKAISTYTSLSQLEPANKSYQQNLDRFNKAEAARLAKVAADQRATAEREERRKKIESQFSSWDGSHRNFERLIKQAMNDPSSYDHVDTRYVDKGKFIRVYCTFRGKNAFGGIVKNTKVADFDIDGNFINEVE